MSIKFSIKNSSDKARKEGDVIVRYSGVSEPFRRVSQRTATKVGIDAQGNPRLVYTTGLNEKQVSLYRWYNDEEKKEVTKQIKELKPIIAHHYGGEDVIDETNAFFWGEENRDINRLSLSNDDIDVWYDTKNASHALLYLGIIAGAFIDLVAPTREWAETHPDIQHYMALETEETYEEEEEITRSDAHGALSELRKDASPEALFILAWCMQYDTNAYGAYLRSTPVKDLVNYHIKYIDGKLSLKKKKNTPKVFMEYVERWKNQQTRPKLMLEAYVKAGEYYNYINQRDKKYTTSEGTALGNTIPEAIENLQKPKYQQDFEALRDKVEAKWKE